MSNIANQPDWSKWKSKEDCFARYHHVTSKLIYGSLPKKKTDISIMVPTYRRTDLLKEAIDSALNQKTTHSMMIAVVDNDSEGNPDTKQLMKQYCAKHPNVLYYRNEQNIGPFGNWNRCIELAQSEWICLLHDDDMMMGNYVECLLNLKLEKDVGLIVSMAQIINTSKDGKLTVPERISNVIGRKNIYPYLRQWKWGATEIFNPTCILLNRSLCFDLGGFDDVFYPASDIIFAMKMARYKKVLFMNKQLSMRRMECNTITDVNIRNETLDIYYKTMLEYYDEIGHSEREKYRKASDLVVSLFMSLNCFKEPYCHEFLKQHLKLNGKYLNKQYQRIFHLYCLAIKFIKVII